MVLLLRILFIMIITPATLLAKEMKCGEDAFPGYPADSSSLSHIYCLKNCGVKQGYIYLVQDTERHWGKNNDKARFKLVRSRFVATNKGPYGNQRIMQKDPALQCLVANRLTPAVAPVSVIADYTASNKEKERAMQTISKVGVQVAGEVNNVLEQVRSMVAGIECAEDESLTFSNVSEQFSGGNLGSNEIAVATQNVVTTMAFAATLSNGKKQEIFQCQAKNNAVIVSQVANNLLLYKPTGDSPREAASYKEGSQ